MTKKRFSIALIFKNITGFAIIDFVSIIMPFLYLPFLVSSVGIETYGELATLQAMMMLAGVLVRFGLNPYAISLLKDDSVDEYSLLTIVVLIRIAVAISTTPMLIFADLYFDFGAFFIVSAFVYSLAEVTSPLWYCHARSRIAEFSAYLIFYRLVSTVLIIVSIHFDIVLETFLLCLAVPYLCANILAYRKFTKTMDRSRGPDLSETSIIFRNSILFGLSRFSSVGADKIPVLALSFSGNPAASGVYDLVFKIIGVLLMPVNIITQSILPVFYGKQLKIITLLCLSMIIAYIPLYGLLNYLWPFIASVFSMPVNHSSAVFNVLFLVIFLNIVSHNVGYHLQLAKGKKISYNLSVISSFLLISVIALYFLSNTSLDAIGFAWLYNAFVFFTLLFRVLSLRTALAT
jgi:polysaccharide transporter, PST family